jgi:hypothetical protein
MEGNDMKWSGTVLKRGVIAGLLGAATVAVWFFVLDLTAGRPFRTPAALGHVLLFGGRGAPADISFGVVASYTLVHILAFALAGWVFVMIAEKVERAPSFLLLAAMTAIVLEAVAIVNLAQAAQWAGLGIWSVIIANMLAVAVMGWYVWHSHPSLRHSLTTAHPAPVRV